MTSPKYRSKIKNFIRQLDQLIESKDWQGAYDVAVALWQYPTYQTEIADEQLRNDYNWALF